MTHKAKIGTLSILALIVIAVFLFIDIGDNWSYVLSRRGWKVAAMVLTGACIAFSTVIFQTITNNRILTPNIIGLDSMYMLAQTGVVYVFGSSTKLLVDNNLNFALTLCLMVLFAGLLYKIMFRGEGNNVYYLLLIGIIMGTLLGSLTTFMQVLIDPNEFLVLQGRMFASYNKVQGQLTVICTIVVILIAAYYSRFAKYMDVLSLGKGQAVNLGVDYNYVVKRLLIIIAALISVSTALVGPITFLGLLVANVTYQFMKTYRHAYLIPASILMSIVALVGGQLIVERVFTFTTTLSVIVNLVGGVYFLYLLLRSNKS
ncbi:iron chelate uptake ABC transporter family permease subunit [Paenibacillus allorhizosphaerae]|uniref:Petrobactin import system permease protein YclO n=1 Tax=Paenibacillus allorhizosphaerae TaxID=2849866 RepID=A0ABM8VIL6_9BACL|nr:iron chelate uptake ABC transporter family permease subunit [Paenibacillus allorhizosphaerae]CAG7644284.1 Petrobactin import system permease protein YclO [Paenibacillus allorhizosphaerae]